MPGSGREKGMAGHRRTPGRWFTQRADRRVLLKASAALAAMAAAPVLTRQLSTQAQDAPVTRSNYFSEVLSGDNFTIASDERVFVADYPFTAIAPHWAGDAPAGCYVEVELSYDGVTWEEPVDIFVAEDGREGDRDGRYFGQLLSSNGHQYVRYATFAADGTPFQLPDLVFTYIDASDGPTVDSLVTVAAETTLVERPEIISRAGWGCNEALRYEDQDTSKDVIWPEEYVPVAHAIIHHSVTPNMRDPMQEIRSIYYYHAITRGWGDIGYNYLVDFHGHVYEGRHGGENVKAGHAFQYNHGSAGICAMGTFDNVDVTPEAQAGLIWITAWAIRGLDPYERKFFIDRPDVPTICGHRDVNDTECPGDVLWSDLPFIRDAVAAVLEGDEEPGIPGEYRIGQAVVVTVNDANVRSGPGLSNGAIRTLASGTPGTVTDGPVTNDGYTWYEIRTSAGTGWMATVTFTRAEKPAGEFAEGDRVYVDTDQLSLRSRAGLSHSVIANMPRGTELRITYAYNRVDGYEWYKVTGSYGSGWVAGEFLSKSQPSTPKPPGAFKNGDSVAVDTDLLSLRSRAGLSGTVIATMPRGTSLRITYAYNRVDGMEWYKVTGSYGDGWVAGQYLTKARPAGEWSVGDLVEVGTDLLSLRSRAGLSSSVIATMPEGTDLRVTYAYNRVDGMEWYKVTGSYGDGWVAGQYLRNRTSSGTPDSPGAIKINYTVYVEDGPLNMRSSPNATASVVTVLPQDAKLQVTDGPATGSGYTWWKLRSSKWGTGWVVADFIGRR